IANRTRFQIRAWNFANTGYSNESTPRVVTVEGESNEFEGSIYGDKVCTGIVTGGDVIYGRLHRVELSEASDNGVYQLGTTSKLSIGTVVYRGSEEGLVIGGNGCEIDSYKIVGRSSAAISMQSGALKITDMRIEGNPEIGSPASILSLRPGYTAKKIEIGNITGTIWGNTLMNMSPGACRSFRLLSADLEFLYTDDRAGAITQWWNLDNAEEIFIQNAKVVIRDIEGDLAGSGSIFEVRLGSQGGAGNKVTLINPEIYIRNNDGGSVPGNSVRIVRLNRGNFSIQGVKIFTNLSHMVGREANYLGPFVAGVNISNNKPTGTFPIGTTVYRGDGASSPYGWVYTQDGWEDLTIP
ncbi:MAG TPA: hypothetical protein VK031_10485, partial [Tissierellaceae bacterium]|nr:hypothetical protein [Tissierellaceae bacterium]